MSQSQKKLVDYSDESDEDFTEESEEESTNYHDKSIPNDTEPINIEVVDLKSILHSQYLEKIALLSEESESSNSSEAPSTSQKSDSTKENGYCSASGSQMKSPNPSEATSKSQRDHNADNGYCSASGSQESQSQSQSDKTEYYEMEEMFEMMNFLIENDKISDCCSIDTWKLMKSKRQPHSLLKQFKGMIAPNIAHFLKTMSKTWVEQLLDEFRKALQQAQIPDTPPSALQSPSPVSLARTLSSTSVDSFKVGASGSTKDQETVASKEPTTLTALVSRKSLDGTIISDSEQETETEDTSLIKVPSLFNGGTSSAANQQTVVKESPQSEIDKSEPVIIPRLKQKKCHPPSVPTNAEGSHPVGIEEESQKENPSAIPEAKIPSRIERKLNDDSQVLTPETTPLQVDSLRRLDNVEQEEPSKSAQKTADPSTIAPIIADSGINAFDDNEPISEEKPAKSTRQSPIIQMTEPSTSAGLRGHGYQPSEHHHLSQQDSDSDSENEFSQSEMLSNVLISLNDSVKKFQLLVNKATTRKNSGTNVKNSRKGRHVAAGSAAHSKPRVAKKKRTKDDDPDYKCPNTLRYTRKRRHETYSDDDADANLEFCTSNKKLKRAQPADSDEVDDSTYSYNDGETKRETDDEDESVSSAASAPSPYLSIRMWEDMYGRIEVEKRKIRERIKFEEDFTMKFPEIPRDSEFSRELLDALHHDMKYDVKICGKQILGDLALLHYFICRPQDIQHYRTHKVFEEIKNLKWEIFQNQTADALYHRVYRSVRGHFGQFGLPKKILDIFMYYEWQDSLVRKAKK